MNIDELYQLVMQIHQYRFGDFGKMIVDKQDGIIVVKSKVAAMNYDGSPIVLAPRNISFVTTFGSTVGESYLEFTVENAIIKHIHSILDRKSVPVELYNQCSRLRLEKLHPTM